MANCLKKKIILGGGEKIFLQKMTFFSFPKETKVTQVKILLSNPKPQNWWNGGLLQINYLNMIAGFHCQKTFHANIFP